ncbi:NYN domain-containing protein [Jeotgalibaca ciconiae]|uniref:NYN domain-containing protein n=1 Tax=Jeotgalibaca ciconiae TaxID=2496265 RepID=A0A3S9HA18_9LACT|nr:NYN domain-containing protein [Jeotgalibaca ciconiae]AZP04195.1 NYN domain-containing protein [Jeotgalibaca ciconiae]
MKKKDILVVDGYNMIGAWPELVKLKNRDLIEEARDRLLVILSNYQEFEGREVWVVFDAQFVPGITKEYTKYKVRVVFTAQGETADTFIEGIVDKLKNVLTEVTVATSDLAEQQLVFARGANRMSANELYKEIKRSTQAIQLESRHFRAASQKKRGSLTEEQLDLLKDLRDFLNEG